MGRPTTTRTRWARAAVLTLAVVLAACSDGDGDGDGDGDDGASSTDTTELAAPAFGGTFACTDEEGDQLDGAAAGETPVSTPIPGTDLLEADVEVVDDELVVRFVTQAPVSAADEPRFVVAKGLPQRPATWFEVRAYVKDGNWVVERRQLPSQVNAEGVAQERVDVVPTTVDVVGTTVSFAVPIDQLPPIDGTPTWQFGTSASGGAVFDDCNELVQ